MIKQWITIAMVLILMCSSVYALEVGGISLPDSVKADKTDLVINGAGLRTSFAIKVYAVGLYLKAKSDNAAAIINADEPMSLCMKWRMSIPPAKIDETYYKSFGTVLNVPKGDGYTAKTNYGPMTKDVVTFMGWLDKKETKKNDVWKYVYIPGKGTEVYIHDGTTEQLMGVIPGLEFKKALFSIWLGEKPPVGNSLKEELLGK